MPNTAKLAFGEGVNPQGLLVLRSVIGAAGMAAFLVARGQTLLISRRYILATALGGLSLAATAGGGMGAVAFIDVSLASVIIFTYPLFVAVVNHVRGEALVVRRDWGLLVLSLFGLALALGVSLDRLNATGVLLALLSSLGITVMVLLLSDTSRAVGAVRANLYMTMWGTLYFLLLGLLGPMAGLIEPMAFPQSRWAWFLVLSAAGTFTLGYLLFFSATLIIGATRASMLSILEPIMMILFAIILVGEWLGPLQWLGMALVLGSLWVMEAFPAQRDKEEQ